jgi:phage gpG-like protein
MNLSISMGPNQGRSVLLQNFQSELPANIRRGMTRAGLILKRQIQKNLSGPGRTIPHKYQPSGRKNPGYGKYMASGLQFWNANPFPGVGSGDLRISVESHVDSDGLGVQVGPHTVYAAIHEFGGRAGRNHSVFIPARPNVWPAFVEQESEIVQTLSESIFGGAHL